MGWRDIFRRSKESKSSRQERLLAKMAELYSQIPDNYWPEFDIVPFAHHPVFDYLKLCWAGVERDPVFERKSLSREFGMKGFNLPALFYLIAIERDIPLERLCAFLSPSIPGADDSTSTMFRKIMTMAESGLDEGRYLSGLAAGVVVDPRQVQYNRVQILEHVDKVETMVKLARAFESLKEQKLHEAVDIEFGEIVEDRGWRT